MGKKILRLSQNILYSFNLDRTYYTDISHRIDRSTLYSFDTNLSTVEIALWSDGLPSFKVLPVEKITFPKTEERKRFPSGLVTPETRRARTQKPTKFDNGYGADT